MAYFTEAELLATLGLQALPGGVTYVGLQPIIDNLVDALCPNVSDATDLKTQAILLGREWIAQILDPNYHSEILREATKQSFRRATQKYVVYDRGA